MDAFSLIIPSDIGPFAALAILAASFLGSFITVAMGIGGGAFLLAFMASFMPPVALIPVHGVVQLGSNVSRAVLFRRKIQWPPVWAFLFGSVLGIFAGGAIVVELPPGYILIGVGGFVLFSVFSRPPKWLRRSAGLTGLVSSFLTMFFGATGPFVATFVKSLSLDKQAHTGTHASLMTIQHGLKVVTFGVLGFSFAPWAGFLIAMIVVGYLGTVVGRRVLLRISTEIFKQLLDAALVLISLHLIWRGGAQLIGG